MAYCFVYCCSATNYLLCAPARVSKEREGHATAGTHHSTPTSRMSRNMCRSCLSTCACTASTLLPCGHLVLVCAAVEQPQQQERKRKRKTRKSEKKSALQAEAPADMHGAEASEGQVQAAAGEAACGNYSCLFIQLAALVDAAC